VLGDISKLAPLPTFSPPFLTLKLLPSNTFGSNSLRQNNYLSIVYSTSISSRRLGDIFWGLRGFASKFSLLEVRHCVPKHASLSWHLTWLDAEGLSTFPERDSSSFRIRGRDFDLPASILRREFFKTSGAAFLTVGALGFEVPASFAEGLPKAGAVAPSFDLPSNRGKNFSNKDLLGKWAVMPHPSPHS
jgi:hypothetical protein